MEQIREQLAYREANKEKVESFRCTRTLGSWTKVMLDEDQQLFMVTHAKNLKEANPDVLRFSDVTGCDIKVDEDRSEVKRKMNRGRKNRISRSGTNTVMISKS